MNYKTISRSFAAMAVVLGLTLGTSALAASPQKVSYYGTPVTSAVPGKPFNLKFRVQNTGDTSYSGVKVVFHLPDGLSASAVAPGNSMTDGNDISWSDVPLEPNQSFYPSFTFAIDKGTPVKTKLSMWVQVTGKDMPETSTNFSVTAASSVATKTTSTLTSGDVSSFFMTIYGRSATASELKYWLSRRADKPGKTALWGAIAFAFANDIKH